MAVDVLGNLGVEREQFVAVLAEWEIGGDPAPVEWAGRAEEDRRLYLPWLLPQQVKKALYEYARKGGDIKRVDETRPEYRHWDFHYDLWPTFGGKVHYFETRFDSRDPEAPVPYIMRFKPHHAS